ncbi:MAG: hypothetical protein ACK4UN_18940 [Limisphaerales bacterium]
MSNLIDAYQRHRLNESGARANYTDDTSEVDDLRRRVAVLELACHALWELLQKQTGAEETLLFQKMQEIDARDGKIDGKSAPAVLECSGCGRRNNTTRTTCLYCGAPLPVSSALV